MMFFQTITVFLFTSFAVPALAVPATLSPRDGPFVHLCTDVNLSGTCVSALIPFDTCQSFANTVLQDAISSVSVTPGAKCTLYKDIDCPGTAGGETVTGVVNNIGEDFNDQPSSLVCNPA